MRSAPSCALSVAGLGLSTLAVNPDAGWAYAAGLGSSARTIAVEAATDSAFGCLWVVQYVLLDRILFRSTRSLVAVPWSNSEAAGLETA